MEAKYASFFLGAGIVLAIVVVYLLMTVVILGEIVGVVVVCIGGYYLWHRHRIAEAERKQRDIETDKKNQELQVMRYETALKAEEVKRLSREHEIDDFKMQLAQVVRYGGSVEWTSNGFKVSGPPVRVVEMSSASLQQQPLLDAPSRRLPQAPPFKAVAPLLQGERFVLCYANDEQGYPEPVLGTIDDLLSTNVTGKPGRGKTSLLYFITAQMLKVAKQLKRKAGITVFDPHGSMMELERVFTYKHNYEDMSEMVPTVDGMIDARLDLFKQRKDVGHPHLFIVDEAPAIAAWEEKQRQLYKQDKRDEPHNSILALVQRIILEARKVKMYVIIAGQSMPASVLPTLARDNLSSHFVFFSSNSHAKMAGLEKDDIELLLPQLKDAGPGLCVVDAARLSGADIGAIPYTTLDDLLEIVQSGESPQFEEDDSHFVRTESLKEQIAEQPYKRPYIIASNGSGAGVLRSADEERCVDTDPESPALAAEEEKAPIFVGFHDAVEFPSENMNEPVEPAEYTPSVFQPGDDDLLLSDLQQQLLIALYRDCSNVNESLSRMKNDEGKGLGGRYYRHASWILEQRGLKKKRA